MSLAPQRRQSLVVACLCVCLSGAALLGIRAQVVPDTLPSQLADREFWALVTESSEPDGFFRSDNLVSNERTYQEVVPELKRRILPNGVYLGVGPDQNFTYISALHPRMAFIVDDLVDTGQTARVVRGILPRAHFATVYAKPMGRPMVDTFITEVSQDTWIYFPWDTGLAFQPPIRDGAT